MTKKILENPAEFARKIKQLDRAKYNLQEPEENPEKRMVHKIMLKIIKTQRATLCECLKKEIEKRGGLTKNIKIPLL